MTCNMLGQPVYCLIEPKLQNILIFGTTQRSSVLCFLSCQGTGQEKFLSSHLISFFAQFLVNQGLCNSIIHSIALPY